MASASRDGPRPKSRNLARLAPLDHVRNLYEGAAAVLAPGGEELRIKEKRDIVAHVRAMVKKADAGAEGDRPVFLHEGPATEPADTTTLALQELEADVNANARVRGAGDSNDACAVAFTCARHPPPCSATMS